MQIRCELLSALLCLVCWAALRGAAPEAQQPGQQPSRGHQQPHEPEQELPQLGGREWPRAPRAGSSTRQRQRQREERTATDFQSIC